MTSLSDGCKESSLHRNQIIPLDFESIKTLPESHVWPESDDFEFNDGELSVPVVDLKDPDAANLIGNACETWGVFQVINHNIPLNLLHEVESETIRLFSLPVGQKLKALRSPGGVVGYGRARISQFFNNYMWHEGFTIMGSPTNHAKLLWPNDYEHFCDVMKDYEKQMNELGTTLVRLIFKYLAISKEETKWVGSSGSTSTALQLNSYPYCPDPDRAMGLAPHTDTSFLTILLQSMTKGLQIFKKGVGWVLVYPTTGALVVNVGDFLHILSNAKFPNVLHRVVMKAAKQQRFSVAFFYCPSPDFNVFPLCSNNDEIPLYRSVSAAEYFDIKTKNLSGPLSLIRN